MRRLFARSWLSDQNVATLLRFATVGAVTTVLDFSLFANLVAAAVPPPYANVASYSSGIVLSYVLNRTWTFGASASRLQALRFGLSVLAGLMISTLLVALLAKAMPAIDAKLVSVPVVFGWNYLTARYWVFNAIEYPKA